MRIPIAMRKMMLALIEQDPGFTLNAIRERLSVRVAESAVCRRLQRLGLTLKERA